MACSKSTVIVTLVSKNQRTSGHAWPGMRVAYHTLQPESANFELVSPLMPTTFTCDRRLRQMFSMQAETDKATTAGDYFLYRHTSPETDRELISCLPRRINLDTLSGD